MSKPLTATQMGLVQCQGCGLLCQAPPPEQDGFCPRCHAPLHARRPGSLQRAWALLIAATILFFPANLLPIMLTTSLGRTQKDTIMSGVVYLWVTGSWPLALVVFVASILVPFAKILALFLLLVTIQLRSDWAPLQRTRLYRLLELVGPWSMLDIYVLGLLVSLVQLQSLATVILPGPAALAFAGVVVLSMLSAMNLDPRMIWDPIGETSD
ncbi:paraquat-inducible protein A [Crenobacter sp. SG2303]|uniref:Paraquat-inducible protein A n=1 Tax=Crenobacter oryzisoli TaxID=3056844 RepID=A0ABT7XK71_9NEIS|nr:MULTISPECIES: paraquat-inducible protein A [unclassified Crenobacter]MDN0074187.1 paraquat-inducible protein A [Crenobacter sp. SG2303]MDN0083459.1 paraquat-inducible protein A [Crenobacter sp. SG2305]